MANRMFFQLDVLVLSLQTQANLPECALIVIMVSFFETTIEKGANLPVSISDKWQETHLV